MRRAFDTRLYRLAWLVAAALVICPRAALGLGLGALQLNSALGEPLAARITLVSVLPAEQRSLSVFVADAKLYQRLGLVRTDAVNGIDVDVAGGNTAAGRVVLQLSSTQTIRTPVLELLVVAATKHSRFVRQYTLLLDPAGSRRRPVRMTNALAVADPAAQPASVYGPVQPGQTLWEIAAAVHYPRVSTYQMVAAIYQANSDAFAGGMGRLRVGSTLTLPAAQKVRAIEQASAQAQLAQAREQRLDRIVAAVQSRYGASLRIAAAGASGQAGPQHAAHGTLRLVTPALYASTDARVPGAGGPMPQAQGRVETGFGTLTMPTRDTTTTSVANAVATYTVASTANAMPVGQLTAAPGLFPGQKPQAKHEDEAAAQGAKRVAADGAPTIAPEADETGDTGERRPADMDSDGMLRLALWFVVVLCLLLAAALWLQTRRLRPRAVPLAGQAVTDDDSES